MNVALTPVRFKQHAVRVHGKKTGVVCGEDRFTYKEFAARANQLSYAIKELGIDVGDRVAFLSFNCHRLLEAYYGVVQIGAVLLPLNIRLNARELTYILNDSGTKALFFDPELSELTKEISTGLAPSTKYVALAGDPPDWAEPENYDDMISGQSTAEPECEIDENSLAELFYTSGTTANPKGVMLSHRNLYLHGMSAMAALQIEDDLVQLHTIPLFHVNGWGTPQYVTCQGGKHVMLRKFDCKTICELTEREKVTRILLVPTMATALVNFPGLTNYDLSSVTFTNIGGAASPVELIREVEQKIGGICVAGYGLTETAPVLTISFPQHGVEYSPEELLRLKAMTGRQVPGVDLRVADDTGTEVPADGQSVGEIVVRSDNVMMGYWNLPEETERALAGGWFHTGDMATINEDGYVLIVDRKKDIIISGGENITSLDIEKAVYGHPAVMECAVIAVPDAKWGEVPKALVVVRPGMEVTETEIIEFCKTRIAGFKVPRSVEFFEVLPKGGTGKILKRELRERYWQGQAKRVN
jgi:fatty-acyl-CoA synthase